MRRVEKIAGALALFLGMTGVASFGQGPPPPPPPLGQPFPNLTRAELARWRMGQGAFLQPASVPAGLGPVFNEAACVQCHGGLKTAPAIGGSGPELVTRFGRVVGGQFDPMLALGGPSIQSKGIGRFNGVNFVGEVVPPQATIVAHRRTTALFGLGLVDAVPDAALMALSAYQHQANPRTAGVVSTIGDPVSGQERVGRFGWKAQEPTLAAFAADALVNELGVTTPALPDENAPQGNASLLAANPAKNHPNQPTNLMVLQLADFMTFNAPPPPAPPTRTSLAGQALFGLIGCAQCHQPTLQAGPSPSAAINGVVFAPYSDFLLHDMGRLGDGIAQGSASTTQMRTAPLWGLRYEIAFLHDGRAQTLDQAILDHQGQGAAAAHNYSTLNPALKAQLVAFLNSL